MVIIELAEPVVLPPFFESKKGEMMFFAMKMDAGMLKWP
jgi:hypothetical protein